MGSCINLHCPICGTEQRVKELAVLGSGYKAVKCNECTVAYLQPIPSDKVLKDYYSKYYLTIQREDRESDLVDLHSGVLQYIVSHLASKENLSILDYGFGSGSFLKLVAKRKHRVFGADLSVQNCLQLESYCKQNHLNITALNLGEGSLSDFGKTDFDVITMFQIIEHLRDPLGSLKELSSLQGSGGLIYVECPNNDALYLKMKNIVHRVTNRTGFYDSLKVPEHIFGFNKRSMNRIFEDAGYEIIDMGDYYFSDGLHQVESIYWWPPFYKNRAILSPRGLVKSLIQASDMLFSKVLNAGGGLHVLAKKR